LRRGNRYKEKDPGQKETSEGVQPFQLPPHIFISSPSLGQFLYLETDLVNSEEISKEKGGHI
jgi:hypothetical protein